MKVHIEEIKRPIISRNTLMKLLITAAVLFWISIIWNSTTELNQQVKSASVRSLAIHDLQVEYKQEIQEWKNVLLRSNNQQSLDKNWALFLAAHQNVATKAQEVVQKNDVSRIVAPIKTFTIAHSENFDQYKKSKEILISSGFSAEKADAAVMGIDRPLLAYLEKSAVAMAEEQKNIDERLAAETRNQIEQSLLILALIAVLVVWMPKWL